MWIIQVALRRPYTFIVLALLLPILGALVILGTPLKPGMPTDIFPEIRIPIIAVTFTYSGMPPDEMSGRITGQIERYVTTLVNDVQHVESQSYPGMTVIKLFFQPGVDINLAMSQVVAFAQLSLKQMPPGTQLAATARAIDPATRTLMAELLVDNTKGELLPGAYAEVHFALPPADAGHSFLLPANVLLFRGDGLHVATVDARGRVVLKPVTVGRDYGSKVEIVSGLSASDHVILSPPDSLVSGAVVRVVKQGGPEA